MVCWIMVTKGVAALLGSTHALENCYSIFLLKNWTVFVPIGVSQGRQKLSNFDAAGVGK